MKNHILLTILTMILSQFLVSCGGLKIQDSGLKTQYLKNASKNNPNYFDGYWSGYRTSGVVAGYKGSANFKAVTIKNGSGEIKRGYAKNSNGDIYWKVQVNENGKVTVSGHYYWNRVKLIRLKGQIGIDPQKPSREVMKLSGTIGPQACTAELTRLLPDQNKKSESERKIMADRTLPKIKILFPKIENGKSRISKKFINIKGRATDDSGVLSVYVNDNKTHIDKNGNFNAYVSLTSEQTLIRIKAFDNNKNKANTFFVITSDNKAKRVP